MSGIKTAFKLHLGQYQEKHLREYLVVKGYSNITVFKNERAFTDLVLHAQAVILDVQNTTLLQAVAEKKSVFLLTRHSHLTESAMSFLAKRVYVAENLVNLPPQSRDTSMEIRSWRIRILSMQSSWSSTGSTEQTGKWWNGCSPS
jgi:hypothetical protein